MSNFRVGVTKGTLVPAQDVEFILDQDILTELSIATDQAERLKAMKDLAPAVRTRRLQSHAVEMLWVKVQDLAKGCDDVARHETWDFLECVIRGQFAQLDIMRAQFFRLIKGHYYDSHKKAKGFNNHEITLDIDLEHRIKILDALTEKGKDILHFEDEIGPFLQKLWGYVLANPREDILHVYLHIVINMIKFNSAYLDPEVICSFIVAFSRICTNSKAEGVKLCLNSLDAVICYNYIPKEGLFAFICLLCRVVNLEEHCTEAWRISRNLMGTHLGHSALYSLCQILQSPDFKDDVALIRGAVFYVGMSLWGAQRVKTLDTYTPMTILPTFESAMDCKHHIVLYEVILQTERLVSKHSQRLRAPGSDAVVILLEKVLRLVPELVQVHLRPEIMSHVHNIITSFESLVSNDRYTLYLPSSDCC